MRLLPSPHEERYLNTNLKKGQRPPYTCIWQQQNRTVISKSCPMWSMKSYKSNVTATSPPKINKQKTRLFPSPSSPSPDLLKIKQTNRQKTETITRNKDRERQIDRQADRERKNHKSTNRNIKAEMMLKILNSPNDSYQTKIQKKNIKELDKKKFSSQ